MSARCLSSGPPPNLLPWLSDRGAAVAAMARMLADCPCCGQTVWIIVSTKLFELNDPTLREDPWGSQVLVPAASAAESSSDGSEGATGATAQAATATGKGEGGHVPAVPGGGGKRNSKGGGHEHEQEHPGEATPPKEEQRKRPRN